MVSKRSKRNVRPSKRAKTLVGKAKGAPKVPVNIGKAIAAIPSQLGFPALLAHPIGAELMQRLSAASTVPRIDTPPELSGAAATVPVTSQMLNTRLSLASKPADGLRALTLDIGASLDPRLQLAIANHRTGKQGLAFASTASDEVAVIARVKSTEVWSALPDVLPGSELGRTRDGSTIVTGRVPVTRIEAVRASEGVISLKASQTIRPSLAATIDAMHVAPAALPQGKSPQGGRGVVVGIVDFGGDFAHRNFRQADGKTRLLALWHQAGVAKPDSPFGYGRAYTRAEIDAALATANPYSALGYGPQPDSLSQTGTHGTHVMDIAAGNGLGSGQAGVAPEADLVFVEASVSDIPWTGHRTVDSEFGDSVQLLEAVRFVFDTAGDRPCVCNLSLGTNGGPHDGTSLVEQGLDAIVKEKPNRAIVIAASNSQQDGIHAEGQVPAGGTHDLAWRQRGEGGEVELWYPGSCRLEVTLIGADGTSFGPVQPGSNLPIGSGGAVAIFISNRLNDPNNGDNTIGIWLASGLDGADWTIRLRSLDGNDAAYHAWIERFDFAQASFVSPSPTHTLGSISTGRDSIVVGSFDAHKPQFPLSAFSSCGPTRDRRLKPEISAPGHNVMAARSRTLTGVVRKSGTSMAAPAVTGLVALVFAEAARNGQKLTIDQLRAKLAASALRNPPAGAGWDPRYGMGRADGGAV